MYDHSLCGSYLWMGCPVAERSGGWVAPSVGAYRSQVFSPLPSMLRLRSAQVHFVITQESVVGGWVNRCLSSYICWSVSKPVFTHLFPSIRLLRNHSGNGYPVAEYPAEFYSAGVSKPVSAQSLPSIRLLRCFGKLSTSASTSLSTSASAGSAQVTQEAVTGVWVNRWLSSSIFWGVSKPVFTHLFPSIRSVK